MSHPVPRALKGEERVLSIPVMDLYLNQTGIIYNGAATIISGVLGKITGNAIIFVVSLFLLNVLAYPLAQTTIKKNIFDGGGVRRDKFLLRKFTYKKKRNLYLRRAKKINL